MECRKTFVYNMTVSAFNAYRKYAWGGPEFRPVSLLVFFEPAVGPYPGLTIFDAMSTFWIMDLKTEWTLGRE